MWKCQLPEQRGRLMRDLYLRSALPPHVVREQRRVEESGGGRAQAHILGARGRRQVRWLRRRPSLAPSIRDPRRSAPGQQDGGGGGGGAAAGGLRGRS
ncbi:Protein of unknown function [Gryllus bimaculatus]|nr:Protein of unknown function [Gryllus bimaculatus]